MTVGSLRSRAAAFPILLALTACRPAPTMRPASPADAPTTPAPAAATAPRPAEVAWSFPVPGGDLPREPNLLPGADREYRGGIHEGVDLFHRTDGSDLPCGTQVVASHPGYIVRADHNWKAMTVREYDFLISALKGRRDEGQLDRLRGRQVWVQADDGRVSRYCHLASVSTDLAVGVRVEAGTLVGTLGNSGTQDGSKGTKSNCHLHFEVRLPPDGAYLGRDLGAKASRHLFAGLFNLPD